MKVRERRVRFWRREIEFQKYNEDRGHRRSDIRTDAVKIFWLETLVDSSNWHVIRRIKNKIHQEKSWTRGNYLTTSDEYRSSHPYMNYERIQIRSELNQRLTMNFKTTSQSQTLNHQYPLSTGVLQHTFERDQRETQLQTLQESWVVDISDLRRTSRSSRLSD